MLKLVIFLLSTAWIAYGATLQGDDKVAPFSKDNGEDNYKVSSLSGDSGEDDDEEMSSFEDNSEIRKKRSIEANAEEDDEIAPLPSSEGNGEGDGEEVPSFSNNEVDTKIVGGKKAPDGAYPHQVSLKRSTWTEFHFCGGSIIFPKWVLTAAHCTKDLQAEEITVLAGTNTISSGGSRYEVAQIVNHEKFNRSSLVNDIALLETKNEFEFGPKIAPIALASKETPVGTETTAVGWGVIRGDSGGPLIADDEIIGIVSYNIKPCGQDYPDVFAKVYSFVDWIKDKVGSE
ncbi:chymotrypsin-2-like isoform X2 [Colias croceus]|uniref:chymotrypsin-2-like isoform X2 n=1 Tax=Colias crocea TaxID=72248 RepID=UPI001E2806A8|nr:chymotrypsin-2-like isoform X2 [Colias croceus]